MTKSDGLQINNLSTGFASKRGGDKVLHENLNLELHPGELVCILGPNGAGKSTLLKTLLGFELPLFGSILFDQTPLDQLTVKNLAKMVSVVLTDKIDDIYLTAREIIATGRYPFGTFNAKLSGEDLLQIEKVEMKVGIEELSDHKFALLSDGEKQKVLIARSLVQETPFIFLDEPVAFIDAPSKIGVMQLLHQMVTEMNKGILMATHDLDAALNFADKIWLLGTNGKWDAGNPEELLEKGKINEYFDKDHVSFDPATGRFVWIENRKH